MFGFARLFMSVCDCTVQRGPDSVKSPDSAYNDDVMG